MEFKFRSHQMDLTSTMVVEAAVDLGHQVHLRMLGLVELVEVVVVLPVERIHQKLVLAERGISKGYDGTYGATNRGGDGGANTGGGGGGNGQSNYSGSGAQAGGGNGGSGIVIISYAT